MDRFITSTFQPDMLNGSLLQNISNNFEAEGDDIIHRNMPIAYVFTLFVCVLGIPGNVLVIAVYIRKMTTSIRMYMFALAVDDLAVCIVLIAVAISPPGYIGFEIAVLFAYLTVTFSVYLLAFVAVERLLAVRHPGTFSLSLSRAKRALVAITVASVACAVVESILRVTGNKMLYEGIQGFNIVSCVTIMIICYTLMGITVVQKERAAHKSVGVVSSAPGPSVMSANKTDVPAVCGTTTTTSSKHTTKPGTTATTAIQPNTLKSMYLLFIITLVFLVSWVPRWMSYVGLEIPALAKRTYLLNSLVNPFIYSAMSRMFRTDVQQFFANIRTRISTCQP